MVKTKEQRKARREERAWNAWLWGAKGNAVWDEGGRTALRIDQALRQNARAAAADVSRVESEQFAWQAGRWGHQPSPAQGDGALLKAALLSLGSCSLNGTREWKHSISESDSKSESSGDDADTARASGKPATASGIRHANYQSSLGMYAFGVERPIQCSCLWSISEKAGEFADHSRRRRLGNLSPFDRVSDDVLMRIFAKLSRRGVIGISSVCRRWRDVASSEPLWRHVELVSVAESLGDRELGLLAEKRLEHTAVLSLALCWRISSQCIGSLMQSQCGQQLLCLDLSFCDMDDCAVSRIVENCSLLQRLRLFGGRETVSGQALAGLANLSQLRELDLGLCVNVSHHTLKEIGSKLKLLVILSLAGCPRVTMANLLYLCGCVSLEALCLVGCKAVYPNQASVIAQELINGGCTRLAMVEAGNQLPNAAPFPARPPPAPPLLYPAQGVSFRSSDSSSDPSGKVENADKCEDGLASVGAGQQTTDRLQYRNVRHGFRTATEMRPPIGRLEGDTQAAYAAATQQFQQGQRELSGGNMGAATDAFRAACHFNPSAAAYTFMAWMQRLAGADRSECVRECARAIFLDSDYGNPWNDVACELWDAGDLRLATRFFQRAKACSRYEVGAGHFPYLNLAKLQLSQCAIVRNRCKGMHDTPSKVALLELCAALIRAPGDEVVQKMVFHMLDGLKECDKLY